MYQAIVEDSTGDKKSYIGLSKNDLKERLGIHKQSFKKRDVNQTCQSSHIWSLKDQGLAYIVTYRLVEKAKPFTPVTGKCQLCLKEKFYIMYRPEVIHLGGLITGLSGNIGSHPFQRSISLIINSSIKLLLLLRQFTYQYYRRNMYASPHIIKEIQSHEPQDLTLLDKYRVADFDFSV